MRSNFCAPHRDDNVQKTSANAIDNARAAHPTTVSLVQQAQCEIDVTNHATFLAEHCNVAPKQTQMAP